MTKHKKNIEKDVSQTGSKKEAINLALAAIEKVHGAGTVLFGKQEPLQHVDFIPTGCISIDRILGGGWARGRIIELLGKESSGKTSTALHAIANVQKQGGMAAFIDMEHALDGQYASNLGVNLENLLISQPITGEQGLEITNNLVSTGALDLIVIDSVAALVPRAELEGEIGDSHMSLQARLMSQALRILPGKAYKTNTTIMFVNQYRQNIKVTWGSGDVASGGNSLKYYATQRVDIRRIGGVEEKGECVANKTRVKCIKNKVAPPFRQCEIQIRYGEGIDIYNDVINLAIESNLIEKKGAWFAMDGKNIGHGEPKTIQYLKDNPEVFQQLWDKLTKE